MGVAARRCLLALACVLASGAAFAAVDAPRSSWTVLHCGVAKGVLYLTYAEDGHAAITPAVDNAVVRAACAEAGYPVGGGAPGRVSIPSRSVDPAGSAGVTRQALAPLRVEPSFTAHAVGSSLSVDGRNDGNVPQSCLISFGWTWDGNSGAPRSLSTQVTLPGRQSNRVVTLTAPGYGARFLAAPQTVCRPLE